jgi:hypothetical protein
MKASMRTVPMVSKKCCRVEVLASDVRELATTLWGLYTEDGIEGGMLLLYMSEEPVEYKDGTCWCEKLRYGMIGGGAPPGPVELRFLLWTGPRGMMGGLAHNSGIGST